MFGGSLRPRKHGLQIYFFNGLKYRHHHPVFGNPYSFAFACALYQFEKSSLGLG